MATDAYLKAHASDRLLAGGPSASPPLARELGTSYMRMNGLLAELESEGVVARTDSDPPLWKLVRPYDGGCWRDIALIILWERAEPMTIGEINEAAEFQGRGCKYSSSELRKLQHKGLLVAGYRGPQLVFWAKGRCTPGLPLSEQSRMKASKSMSEKIVAYLADAGYPVDSTTIAFDLSVDLPSAKAAILHLYKSGKLDRVKSKNGTEFLYCVPGKEASA